MYKVKLMPERKSWDAMIQEKKLRKWTKLDNETRGTWKIIRHDVIIQSTIFIDKVKEINNKYSKIYKKIQINWTIINKLIYKKRAQLLIH